MLTKKEFEKFLDEVCTVLRQEAKNAPFKSQDIFENRVRALCIAKIPAYADIVINPEPVPPIFPDVPIGEYGVEVKFTLKDTWRSVANSIQEKNKADGVQHIYVIFGKMGGIPDVKWQLYEDSVIHVRTSHVPRFEVEIESDRPSLFEGFGISYAEFADLDMHEKMEYIRKYARNRLKEGERLWWIEDIDAVDSHDLPLEVRLYTSLPQEEKIRLRAEAALVSPRIVCSGRAKHKYDNAVLYLITYRGVLCHQARDLFSAGSVANSAEDYRGGNYVEKSLKLIEHEIEKAALEMDDALIVEYWGESVPTEKRLEYWIKMLDDLADGWIPSESLFNGRYKAK